MSNIAKAAVGMMIGVMLSKILGFGREVVLGAMYGATRYSDIYITAMNIPGTIFALIGTALTTTFIPIYYEKMNTESEQESIYFTNNVLNIVSIVGIIMSIIIFIFAEPIVRVFAMGFDKEKITITVNFIRIMIFGGAFIGLTNIMTSFLQIKNNFIIPALIGIPYNILIIISIIISKDLSIYILPIGTLIAMASQFLFQYPFARLNGYKYKTFININDKYLRKMINLMIPVFIGVAVNQINAMIDRTLASTLIEGSISALNYANRLNLFIMALFTATIGAVVYPMLSKISSSNNKHELANSIVKTMNSVAILLLPISIGAMVLSKPIIEILFQRGAFDETATKMTSISLICYSVGMVAFGLRDIISRVFYSIQDTRTPMVNGMVAMVLNIVLNIVLVKYFSYAGLALATSISSNVCIVLLFISLNKKIGYFGHDKIIKTIIKSFIASIIMGIIVLIIQQISIYVFGISFVGKVISLVLSIVVGIIIYGILIVLLKIEEVYIMLEMIKGKLLK